MNLARFRAALRARRPVLLALPVLAAALAAAASFGLTQRHVALASLVLQVKTSDPVAGVALSGSMVANHIATQIDVIRSERVLLRAIRDLDLGADAALRERWQRDGGQAEFEPWLAARLARRLEVRPGRESSVVTLAFGDPDPRFAAAFANAMLQAYVATSLDIRTDPARQYSRYFGEQARTLRTALEQAQARLVAHQREHGLVATDEKVGIETARLTELASRETALQAGVAETRGRTRQAGIAPQRLREVLDDRVVASLTEELARQQARLEELGQRLGDRHPQVVESRSGIEELSRRHAAALQRAAASVGSGARIAQAQLDDLERDLRRQRELVLKLRAERDAASLLEREVDSAQRAYDAVLARASQAALESGDTQPDVAVLQRASVPTPQPLLRALRFGAGGALGGLALALLLVLLRESADRRVRSAADITHGLRLDLLASLPAMHFAPLDKGKPA